MSTVIASEGRRDNRDDKGCWCNNRVGDGGVCKEENQVWEGKSSLICTY